MLTIQNPDFLSQLSAEAEALEKKLAVLFYEQRIKGEYIASLSNRFKYECVSHLKEALADMQIAFRGPEQ